MIRVVICDDHPAFRSGVRAVLEQASDIEVIGEAEDGPTSVALSLDLAPDVVLLDLAMPGLDGTTACQQITAASKVRVLVLTMSSSDHSILTSLKAGAAGYLLKNARADEIINGIRSAAAGQTVLSGEVAERVNAFIGGSTTGARPFADLTEREHDVLDLVARGLDNAAIARRLFVSPKTVRNYVSAIMAKIHADDRAHAGAIARNAGMGDSGQSTESPPGP